MKAITIRDNTGALLAFGPEGRGYDPGVPVGATKAIEDSYDAVYTEYVAFQAQLPVAETLEQKVADLQDQVAAINLSVGVTSGVKTS